MPVTMVIIVHLIEYISNRLFREKFALTSHQLIEIFFHVFEYKIERVVFSDDFFEFDQIRVIQFFQRLKQIDTSSQF